MTTAPKRIATSNQMATAVMGRLGKGPADRANIIGTIVDQSYDFGTADSSLDELLAFMVERGLIERVETPSLYAKGVTYPVYRLPSSTPIERDAEAVGETRPGHITPEQFRAQAQRKRK